MFILAPLLSVLFARSPILVLALYGCYSSLLFDFNFMGNFQTSRSQSTANIIDFQWNSSAMHTDVLVVVLSSNHICSIYLRLLKFTYLTICVMVINCFCIIVIFSSLNTYIQIISWERRIKIQCKYKENKRKTILLHSPNKRIQLVELESFFCLSIQLNDVVLI